MRETSYRTPDPDTRLIFERGQVTIGDQPIGGTLHANRLIPENDVPDLDGAAWFGAVLRLQPPEIPDLAEMLIAMGAKIEGHGTSKIRIQGVERLNGGTHQVVADRIEAGTFLCAVAATGGEVLLRHGRADHLEAVIEKLQAAPSDASRVSPLRSARRRMVVVSRPPTTCRAPAWGWRAGTPSSSRVH